MRTSTSPHLAGRTILQIIPHLHTGGAERTAVDIAAGLAEAGARALVATEGGRLVAELQAKGGIWLPFPAAAKNPLAMATHVGKLARLCAQERVDLIHARSRAPGWVALGAARLVKVPFVTTFHGVYSGRSVVKTLYNSVMARGDVVIANSHFTADHVAQIWPMARPRLRVIHRGIDFASFRPATVAPSRVRALRQDWQVAPDQRIVLLPARLSPIKGHRVLIDAARQMAAEGRDDLVFILAGDAQERNGYVAQVDGWIAEAGLQASVRRVGHCADMPAALLAASVVAVTSTVPEAFGRIAVEAQAMGTPVVVSDLGAASETVLGPPQVAAAARTGWRTPANDSAALAGALREALDLRASARDALAERAAAHVTTRFSVDAMIAATFDVYAALLGQ